MELDTESDTDLDSGSGDRGDDVALTVIPSDRDMAGRFAPGHAPMSRGRPPGRSITSVLRRLVSPEQIATRLIAFATDPEVPRREQLAALGMILDRLEGRPVSTSVVEMSVERSENQGVPPGFYTEWTAEERRQWLAVRVAKQVGQ